MPLLDPTPPPALTAFPHTRYHAAWRLSTWHPRGVLDDALLDQVVAFIVSKEHVAELPFDRFTDFNGLTEIHLKVGHVFDIVHDRREEDAARAPVKSAFFADKIVAFGMARMYEALMEGSSIQVRAFRDRQEAAQWLGVPVEILCADP